MFQFGVSGRLVWGVNPTNPLSGAWTDLCNVQKGALM